MSSESCDVAVIGGGPSGCCAATLLAKHGRDVRLFERESGPRFHIGESLIPMTYWPLERMGMLDRLRRSKFPRKYSVQFINPDGRESKPFFFFETNPHTSAITWQVWRAHFDRLLLDNAAEKGVRVTKKARVTEVLFEGDRAVGVRVKVDGGPPQEVRAKVVIDASGQSSILANRGGATERNVFLRNGAVWSYFKGAQRAPGIDGGATLVISVARRGWFWFIPLPGDVTSIGCVASMDYLLGRGLPHEEVFAGELADCPALQERLEGAKRVKPYYATKDYSYITQLVAGDGYVMVGDAFGFIDPMYSTGLLLALKSGEFAADAIHEALAAGDVSGARIGAWQETHRTAIHTFRRMVYAFYSRDFSFGKFIRKHPEFRQNVVDILAGDVYEKDFGPMFEAIGDVTPTHAEAAAEKTAETAKSKSAAKTAS
ncbi:MAG TPA: NAD(P)/FAD-dependent oxidoreductase [Planctomycetia bacterium]|nr:NAD(P)/FAD-dependent oxidoreductase [Planctomycetia bacterium]